MECKWRDSALSAGDPSISEAAADTSLSPVLDALTNGNLGSGMIPGSLGDRSSDADGGKVSDFDRLTNPDGSNDGALDDEAVIDDSDGSLEVRATGGDNLNDAINGGDGEKCSPEKEAAGNDGSLEVKATDGGDGKKCNPEGKAAGGSDGGGSNPNCSIAVCVDSDLRAEVDAAEGA